VSLRLLLDFVLFGGFWGGEGFTTAHPAPVSPIGIEPILLLVHGTPLDTLIGVSEVRFNWLWRLP